MFSASRNKASKKAKQIRKEPDAVDTDVSTTDDGHCKTRNKKASSILTKHMTTTTKPSAPVGPLRPRVPPQPIQTFLASNTQPQGSVGGNGAKEPVTTTKSQGGVGANNAQEPVMTMQPHGSIGSDISPEPVMPTQPQGTVGGTSPTQPVTPTQPQNSVGGAGPSHPFDKALQNQAERRIDGQQPWHYYHQNASNTNGLYVAGENQATNSHFMQQHITSGVFNGGVQFVNNDMFLGEFCAENENPQYQPTNCSQIQQQRKNYSSGLFGFGNLLTDANSVVDGSACAPFNNLDTGIEEMNSSQENTLTELLGPAGEGSTSTLVGDGANATTPSRGSGSESARQYAMSNVILRPHILKFTVEKISGKTKNCM